MTDHARKNATVASGGASTNEAGSFRSCGSNSTAPFERVLARLEGVQKSGRGWRAMCPACGGKSRKVSITEAENGATLLHAFCGCPPAEVLGAVGLEIGDLFPERLRPMNEAERRDARQRARESGWRAALDVLQLESAVVEVAASELHRLCAIDEVDRARLALACTRIRDARAVLR